MTGPDPVTIVFLGNPVAKGRPRFAKNGVTYTPAKTKSHELNLRYDAAQAMLAQVGEGMFVEPVELVVRADMKIPKTWSNKQKNAAIIGIKRPGTRPDLDNIIKLVKDALNGVVWRDDSLVCELRASKHYSNQPKLIIKVSAL